VFYEIWYQAREGKQRSAPWKLHVPLARSAKEAAAAVEKILIERNPILLQVHPVEDDPGLKRAQ
jgi:hypothetical protein